MASRPPAPLAGRLRARRLGGILIFVCIAGAMVFQTEALWPSTILRAGLIAFRGDVFLDGEAQRWSLAVKEATRSNVTLQVFYHTSLWQPFCTDVIAEQLLTLDGRRPLNFLHGHHPLDQEVAVAKTNRSRLQFSGGIVWAPEHWASVMDFADGLHVTVAGDNETEASVVDAFITGLSLRHRSKIEVHFNRTVPRMAYRAGDAAARAALMRLPLNVTSGEAATSSAMHEYCIRETAAGRTAFVLYLHSKGGGWSRTTQPQDNPIAAWREMLNTFNIEFPSLCLRALIDGYSTCGANLQSPAHYSGNFFWARCDHVAALSPLRNRFDPWEVELWPWYVSLDQKMRDLISENCAYSAFNLPGPDHYDREHPKSAYREKVRRYVRTAKLPRNPVSTTVASPAWVRKVCGTLRETPYARQPFWANASAIPFNRSRSPDVDHGV